MQRFAHDIKRGVGFSGKIKSAAGANKRRGVPRCHEWENPPLPSFVSVLRKYTAEHYKTEQNAAYSCKTAREFGITLMFA